MAAAGASARVTMFGLDVWGNGAMPSLGSTAAEATGRRLELSFEGGADERLGFPTSARPISDERGPGGELVFQIERDEAAGYLIWGPRYGANLLGRGADSVLCRPGEGGLDAWLRLFVAQVLPFAAVVRGLEVLHASAVVVDGRAVVLAGRAGAGKSATAAALRRRGAAFLADDVVALEGKGEALIAHPGAPFQTAPGDREALVPAGPVTGPAPLGALFFLDRRRDGPPEPRFEPVVDPKLLLAATFNMVLVSAARLQALLEISAAIAEHRGERVVAGPGADPDRIAAALAERIGDSG
jgi:hypothetical protein